MEITKHFTCTVYIVNQNQVLLHKHKKLNLILPPGGHIDRDELPIQAAYREVDEECGVKIEMYSDKEFEEFENSSFETNVGMFCNVHFINPFHQHIDFVFFAKALDPKITLRENESQKWFWMSKDEILNSKSISSPIKKYALHAIDTINQSNF